MKKLKAIKISFGLFFIVLGITLFMINYYLPGSLIFLGGVGFYITGSMKEDKK